MARRGYGHRGRLRLFRFVTAAIVVVVAVLLDLAAGLWHDTADIRTTSRLFRSEAAPLAVATRRLLPNLDHRYALDERPPGDDTVPAGSERRFRTDGRGLVRGDETDRAADAPPRLEILFLGGSTTESNQVDEPFRFPALVGRRLSERLGRSVAALNGGVRGHTVRDSLNALLNRREFAGAQTVVLMHNINDRLVLARRGGYVTVREGTAPTTGARLRQAAGGLVGAIWDYVSYRSNLLYLLRTRLWGEALWLGRDQRIFADQGRLDYADPTPERSLLAFRRGLAVFAAVVRATGRRPVLMTQPLGRDSPGQDRFNEAIRDVAERLDVALIDLAARFPDAAGLFLRDDIHFSNKGSMAAADIIVEALIGILGPTDPPAPTFMGE